MPLSFRTTTAARAQWTLRGLHFQVEHTQGKLVRVTSGSVFDVMVDLRRSSSSFGAWWGVELSAENHRMLWVPPGLAHGILVTSETADFLYKCTDFYSPAHERTLAWNDPALGDQMAAARGHRARSCRRRTHKARASPRSRNSHESAGARRRRPNRAQPCARLRLLQHEVVMKTRAQLDIGDAEGVARALQESRAEWIVNGAAYTAVDLAEDQPEQAHRGQ